MTRLAGVAWFKIAAVSTISTMKVERPRARSSAAPTRENSRSITPITARSAGTKLPTCASTAISAFWRRKVLLPAMFGPVSSHSRRCSDRSASLAMNRAAWRASACSTTGWRPPWIRNCRPSSISGRT